MRAFDLLLFLMVVIWGANYSVIKRAFVEIPPLPFNALRLVIASAVFFAAIRIARWRAHRVAPDRTGVFHTHDDLTRRDRLDLVWLGLIGHCAYQLTFVSGVAATSVSNAALILGATPVVVAILSAALGRERIGAMHWIGAAISASGIYLVVGHGASFGGATLHGDLLMLLSVACWAVYTLAGSRLIARHSPLYVTGMSMVIGTIPYLLIVAPQFASVHWGAVSAWTWTALVLSALLALCVAYTVWYAAVRRLGAARTAIYSNAVPLAAMAVAAVWLHERMTPIKIAGATAVILGVALTRLGRKSPVVVAIEE